jgi:uncharacterized membrane protein YdbT with pleckstrin-like domain
LKPWYYAAFGSLALAFGINNNRAQPFEWLIFPPVLLFAYVLWRHLELRSNLISIAGSRLDYRAGIFSKAKLSLEADKIKAIRTDQTMLDRLLGLGTLIIESGATEKIFMRGVEHVAETADRLRQALSLKK